MERVYSIVSHTLAEQYPALLSMAGTKFGDYLTEGIIPGQPCAFYLSFHSDILIFTEDESRVVDIVIVPDGEGFIIDTIEKPAA